MYRRGILGKLFSLIIDIVLGIRDVIVVAIFGEDAMPVDTPNDTLNVVNSKEKTKSKTNLKETKEIEKKKKERNNEEKEKKDIVIKGGSKGNVEEDPLDDPSQEGNTKQGVSLVFTSSPVPSLEDARKNFQEVLSQNEFLDNIKKDSGEGIIFSYNDKKFICKNVEQEPLEDRPGYIRTYKIIESETQTEICKLTLKYHENDNNDMVSDWGFDFTENCDLSIFNTNNIEIGDGDGSGVSNLPDKIPEEVVRQFDESFEIDNEEENSQEDNPNNENNTNTTSNVDEQINEDRVNKENAEVTKDSTPTNINHNDKTTKKKKTSSSKTDDEKNDKKPTEPFNKGISKQHNSSPQNTSNQKTIASDNAPDNNPSTQVNCFEFIRTVKELTDCSDIKLLIGCIEIHGTPYSISEAAGSSTGVYRCYANGELKEKSPDDGTYHKVPSPDNRKMGEVCKYVANNFHNVVNTLEYQLIRILSDNPKEVATVHTVHYCSDGNKAILSNPDNGQEIGIFEKGELKLNNNVSTIDDAIKESSNKSLTLPDIIEIAKSKDSDRFKAAISMLNPSEQNELKTMLDNSMGTQSSGLANKNIEKANEILSAQIPFDSISTDDITAR